MTVTLNRKLRQRQEREDLILEHAARLLARDGFQDLNLDELAQAVEYSKGTLYLHFKTKEDLVLAVATHALRHRADLLERGAAYPGSTRTRARAMGFACCEFTATHPEFFTVELMLQARSFWNRVSKVRQDDHATETRRVWTLLNRVVQEAMAAGDLPVNTPIEDVSLSVMAVTVGSHCVVTQPQLQAVCGIPDPAAAMLLHQERMLDGWGWKPMGNGRRQTAQDRRICKDLFPNATWFKA
jgi:AcrR family transcriptional regulator